MISIVADIRSIMATADKIAKNGDKTKVVKVDTKSTTKGTK